MKIFKYKNVLIAPVNRKNEKKNFFFSYFSSLTGMINFLEERKFQVRIWKSHKVNTDLFFSIFFYSSRTCYPLLSHKRVGSRLRSCFINMTMGNDKKGAGKPLVETFLIFLT